jgi:uncharacterized membrane protein
MLEQQAAPPQSKLVLVTFPDQGKVDQPIGAILTKLISDGRTKVYRLAVVTRGPEGKISVKDVTKESHGTVLAGALIGGVSGLAAGPLGAAIAAGAGALLGWSAELINEGAVTEFAEHWSKLPLGCRGILAEVSEEAATEFEDLMVINGGLVCT